MLDRSLSQKSSNGSLGVPTRSGRAWTGEGCASGLVDEPEPRASEQDRGLLRVDVTVGVGGSGISMALLDLPLDDLVAGLGGVVTADTQLGATLEVDVVESVLEAVSVDETGTVEATADLVAHTWGTEIKLTASGLNAGEAYQVAVLNARGAEIGAGTFVGTDAENRCNLNAALLREEAEGFVVRDQEGQQVLSSDFAT